MTIWGSIYLQESNSPRIEELISFHGYTIAIIIRIIFLIFYIFFIILYNNFICLNFLENHILETIWTRIPALILTIIALPRLRLLYLIDESFNPELIIKILGHQWYWSYEYPHFNIELDSFIINDNKPYLFRLLDVDNRIIIPFWTQTQLLISSTDVIHAWTIPSLGIKIDAVPGRINQRTFLSYRPGLFFGQCSEICGANHSFIPICIEVTSLEYFFNWINKN